LVKHETVAGAVNQENYWQIKHKIMYISIEICIKEMSQNMSLMQDYFLRFAAFWATFNIWTKRQRLNRTYWNIVPETWKHNEN